MTARLTRSLILVGCALLALGPLATQAQSHAVLITSTPETNQRLDTAPPRLSLTFSETITLLAGSNLDVLDEQGRSVAAGPGAVSPSNAKVIELPLRAGLPGGTYTPKFSIVSADSHAITGRFVFGVGPGPLKAPVAVAVGGPGEMSAWSVTARFAEFVCLGGLLGLLAFRWLVWRPTWLRAPRPRDGRVDAAARWASSQFWAAFAAVGMLAVLAEGYLLVTKSASALGQGVGATLTDPAGISQVMRDTRFGDLWQVRILLLFALLAIAAWEFLAEPVVDEGEPGMQAPPPANVPTRGGVRPTDPVPALAGRRFPAALMAVVLLISLVSVSLQGHASTAPWSALQITADAVHLVAVSIWVTGIALLAWTLFRLPNVVGGDGPLLSAGILARFSQVATVAVIVVLATGTVRSIGELSGIAQLWETGYGRSIAFKIALLGPIGFLALRNRKILAALTRVRQPNRATLRMIRRTAALEFSIALVVVVVASILVSQVPGRVS